MGMSAIEGIEFLCEAPHPGPLPAPSSQGENSPKPITRIEPMNRNNDCDSVSLSSPKGGEGWGLSRHSFCATADEEAFMAQGEIYWMFDVPRVHGEGDDSQGQCRDAPCGLSRSRVSTGSHSQNNCRVLE